MIFKQKETLPETGIAGGKHCESLQRNVWRGVVSALKAVSPDIECRTLP